MAVRGRSRAGPPWVGNEPAGARRPAGVGMECVLRPSRAVLNAGRFRRAGNADFRGDPMFWNRAPRNASESRADPRRSLFGAALEPKGSRRRSGGRAVRKYLRRSPARHALRTGDRVARWGSAEDRHPVPRDGHGSRETPVRPRRVRSPPVPAPSVRATAAPDTALSPCPTRDPTVAGGVRPPPGRWRDRNRNTRRYEDRGRTSAPTALPVGLVIPPSRDPWRIAGRSRTLIAPGASYPSVVAYAHAPRRAFRRSRRVAHSRPPLPG